MSPSGPNWDRLFETASAQEGYFTTAQADDVGYSPQLLAKYLQNGRVVRARRGIYRLVHFPPGEHEELTMVWLWSEREGVFSHETALSLHALSDVLPERIHLTLPAEWAKRRFRVPEGVVLHHADVAERERAWAGSVPVTSPRRTLVDVRRARLPRARRAGDPASGRARPHRQEGGAHPRPVVRCLKRASQKRRASSSASSSALSSPGHWPQTAATPERGPCATRSFPRSSSRGRGAARSDRRRRAASRARTVRLINASG